MANNQLKMAKINLYRLLAQIEPRKLSDTDVDLLAALAADEQVQSVFVEVTQ